MQQTGQEIVARSSAEKTVKSPAARSQPPSSKTTPKKRPVVAQKQGPAGDPAEKAAPPRNVQEKRKRSNISSQSKENMAENEGMLPSDCRRCALQRTRCKCKGDTSASGHCVPFIGLEVLEPCILMAYELCHTLRFGFSSGFIAYTASSMSLRQVTL